MDRQKPVTKLKIDSIELLHLVPADDMPEIPAYQDIDGGDGGQSNVEHIIPKPWAEHLVIHIGSQDGRRLLGDGQDLCDREKLSVKRSHNGWSWLNLSRRHVREDQAKPSSSKILHKPIRPESKLRIETAADH